MNSNNITYNMNKDISDEDFDRMLDEHFSNDRYVKVGLSNLLKSWNPVFKENLYKAKSSESYKQNLTEGKQRFWANVDQSHRDHIAKKSFEAHISFESKAQAKEIFYQCWDENRGEKLYQELAKKYNVSFHGIISLVRGSFNDTVHAYCPVSYDELERMKLEWEQKYKSYEIIVDTPGCDLLDIYDKLYRESLLFTTLTLAQQMTTPSIVYHCRYNLENPTPHSVREYCDSIDIPRLKNDLVQYKNILYNKWKWLTTEKSTRYIFNSYNEVNKFLTAHSENKTGKKIDCQQGKMPITWRDGYSFAGWMIRKI